MSRSTYKEIFEMDNDTLLSKVKEKAVVFERMIKELNEKCPVRKDLPDRI